MFRENFSIYYYFFQKKTTLLFERRATNKKIGMECYQFNYLTNDFRWNLS